MLDSAGELEETVRCTPKLFCPGDEEARAFVLRFWCRFGWVAPRGISSQLFELDSSWTVVDAGPVGTTGRTPAAAEGGAVGLKHVFWSEDERWEGDLFPTLIRRQPR